MRTHPPPTTAAAVATATSEQPVIYFYREKNAPCFLWTLALAPCLCPMVWYVIYYIYVHIYTFIHLHLHIVCALHTSIAHVLTHRYVFMLLQEVSCDCHGEWVVVWFFVRMYAKYDWSSQHPRSGSHWPCQWNLWMGWLWDTETIAIVGYRLHRSEWTGRTNTNQERERDGDELHILVSRSWNGGQYLNDVGGIISENKKVAPKTLRTSDVQRIGLNALRMDRHNDYYNRQENFKTYIFDCYI